MLGGARSPRCHPPFLLLQLLLRSKRPLPGRHLAFLLPDQETEAWLLRFSSPAPKSLVIHPKKPPQGKEEGVPFSTTEIRLCIHPASRSPTALGCFFLFAGEKSFSYRIPAAFFCPKSRSILKKNPIPIPKRPAACLLQGDFCSGTWQVRIWGCLVLFCTLTPAQRRPRAT